MSSHSRVLISRPKAKVDREFYEIGYRPRMFLDLPTYLIIYLLVHRFLRSGSFGHPNVPSLGDRVLGSTVGSSSCRPLSLFGVQSPHPTPEFNFLFRSSVRIGHNPSSVRVTSHTRVELLLVRVSTPSPSDHPSPIPYILRSQYP